MLERSSTSEISGFGILHPDIPDMQASLKKGAFLHVEKEHEILVTITLATSKQMFYNTNINIW